MDPDLKAALEALNATVDRLEAALAQHLRQDQATRHDRAQLVAELDTVIETIAQVLDQDGAGPGGVDPGGQGDRAGRVGPGGVGFGDLPGLERPRATGATRAPGAGSAQQKG